VTYLEMKQLLEDAQASMWTSLRHGLEANGPLTRADRSEVVGEIKVLRTLAANNDYTPKAQAMADAVLANANINLSRTSDTYQQFCVETTKMLDGLWQAYLAHSEAMDGYTGPLKSCPAPAHRHHQTPLSFDADRHPKPMTHAYTGGSKLDVDSHSMNARASYNAMAAMMFRVGSFAAGLSTHTNCTLLSINGYCQLNDIQTAQPIDGFIPLLFGHNLGARHFMPFAIFPRAKLAIVNRSRQVPTQSEQISYHAINRKKALCLSS
jgi:hypothetical protein